MLKKTLLALALLVGLLAFAQTVSAQAGAPSDDEVNRIAKKLFCPV